MGTFPELAASLGLQYISVVFLSLFLVNFLFGCQDRGWFVFNPVPCHC